MAGPNGRPGVGIVSDVVLQRHRLQAATGKFGLDVSFSGDPERLMDYPAFPDAALWLVTLEDEADHPALFEHLLENTEAPVLFGLDQAPKPGTTEYFRWERRLLDKLEKQLGHLERNIALEPGQNPLHPEQTQPIHDLLLQCMLRIHKVARQGAVSPEAKVGSVVVLVAPRTRLGVALPTAPGEERRAVEGVVEY